MCGIAGLVGGMTGDAMGDAVGQMADAMAHRGPDGRGVFVGEGAALGACRLAIVAPSRGAQPIVDGALALVANAEIYNHRALRAELERGGARFVTDSDVEVILHGYRRWGVGVLERLRGFFGFALWDGERRELFCARDRLGIAPLVWTRVGGGGVAVASEVKGLLALPGVHASLDLAAVAGLLEARYAVGPGTFFREVEHLQPGHRIRFDAEGRGEPVCWYEPPRAGSAGAMEADPDRAEERLEAALGDAVRARLTHGEAPVGLYLSGGLDSSLIAALARGQGATPAGFSHGFDRRDDELDYAELAGRLTGGRWHPVILGPEDIDALPDIVRAVEQPVANPDIVGLWALAREASRHVKVVLCGEGADELFGSYPHQLLLDGADRHPRAARAAAAVLGRVPGGLLGRLGPYPGALGDPRGRARLVQALSGAGRGGDAAAAVGALSQLFDPEERRALLTLEALEAAGPGGGRGADVAPGRLHDWLVDQGLSGWLDGYHLGRENRIAMAFGLEARYPFLDEAVVEAVLPLSRRARVGAWPPRDKHLLRRIANRRLPRKLAKRPKGPVRVPLSLFGPRWPALRDAVLSEDRLRRQGIFRPQAVRALRTRAATEPFLADRQLFALVMVGLWLDTFGGA